MCVKNCKHEREKEGKEHNDSMHESSDFLQTKEGNNQTKQRFDDTYKFLSFLLSSNFKMQS